MSPERWQKIESIFQTALDLSPAERPAFLADECAGDESLRIEIEKLIANYESAESFIESPVWTDSQFLNSTAKKEISASLEQEVKEFENETLIGQQIGVYRLTKEIGRGGMGAVFLAMRADGEFSQKVAIKLIKRGMDTDFIVRRFRHERQILASFEHPFIARLLDGGTTPGGMPYFVMEYIEGETLYNFCDHKRLNLTERLKIFQKICSAVAYAHERQIIHRDIKPSNILVTRHNEPKLLDFGIAKVLDPDLIHESVSPTASMMRLMTPDYASPEQVCGTEVTPASDIYSLGILLYELLTGHRPYNFTGRALHEVSRVICEVAPERPSRIIARRENLLPQYAKSDDGFAHARATDREELKDELADNLDNIVLKALAKDAPERYLSVQDFSRDITRHLRGQEVHAAAFRGKANEYRLPPPTSAKSLAVLPFKFLNVSRSDETGDKFLGVGLADALITRLSKVRRFVVRPTGSILGFEENGIDPLSAARRLDVSYILDGNIKKAGERLRVTVQLLDVAQNSTVWATSIDETISDLFSLEDTLSNKVIEALLPQLTGGELEEFSKRGTESAEAFEQYLRGRYYFNSGTEDGFAKAFVSFHQAIAADPNYAHAYAGVADYYSWLGIYGVLPPNECFQPAIEAARRAVEIDDRLAEAHATLGFAVHAGDYDQKTAEHHLLRALELNPNFASAYAWLAIVRFTEGRFQEGLQLAERSVELDPLTPYNHHNIAWGFYYARRFDDGVKQYRKAIEEFPSYGLNYYGLSKILRAQGKTAEALDAIAKARTIFGESVFIKLAEAESYAADRQTKKAHEKLAELKKMSGERYVSPYQLALVYCYLKDKETALRSLEKALEINEAWLNWMTVDPAFDFLRSEPRFRKIVATVKSPNLTSADTDPDSFRPRTGDLLEAETALYTEPKRIKSRFPAWFKYAAAFLFLCGGAFLVYKIAAYTSVNFSFSTVAPWENNFVSTMNVRRLTNSGKVSSAAISPDGRMVAYSMKTGEKQSIWLRSSDAADEGREIVPPADYLLNGITFSPDGKYIYYSTFSLDYKERLLHRVRAVNEPGEPQKVLDNVNSRIDFAPDGKSFCFFRFDSPNRVMSLQTAEFDAEEGAVTATKLLASIKQPSYFSGNPSFAPDGEKIVYAVGQSVDRKVTVRLFVFDPTQNSETPLGEQTYADVLSIIWRRNEDEIVFSASEKEDAPHELVLLKYPDGRTMPLTNDLSSYPQASAAVGADALAAVKKQRNSNLWAADAANAANAFQLTDGANSHDGFDGLSVTPDGEILFVGGTETENLLALAGADGKNKRFLKTGILSPKNPSMTADRRYVVFGGVKEGGGATIWRYDTQTEQTEQLTPDYAVTPTITPDGKFVIYAANNDKRKISLHKIPIEGGEQTILTADLSIRPVVSPDGKKIVCYFLGEKSGSAWKIAILPIEGGEPLQILDPPDTANLENPLLRPLAWSPDSSAVFYVNDKGDFSNIYKLNLASGAKPEKVTDFSSGRIFAFALAPDAKRFIFSRGISNSDIVLFRKANNVNQE